jgi:hypothetical protein
MSKRVLVDVQEERANGCWVASIVDSRAMSANIFFLAAIVTARHYMMHMWLKESDLPRDRPVIVSTLSWDANLLKTADHVRKLGGRESEAAATMERQGGIYLVPESTIYMQVVYRLGRNYPAASAVSSVLHLGRQNVHPEAITFDNFVGETVRHASICWSCTLDQWADLSPMLTNAARLAASFEFSQCF